MCSWTQFVIHVWCFAVFLCSVKAGEFACPDGWEKFLGKCYIEGGRQAQFQALSECNKLGAHLWRPENKAENEHFIDSEIPSYYIMDLTRENDYWLTRAKFDYRLHQYSKTLDVYHNMSATDLYPLEGRTKCAVFHTRSGAWKLERCSMVTNVRCERPANCSSGYFGEGCKHQCHCAGSPCDEVRGICPEGCSAGWAGTTCSQKKEKANGMFYCLEMTEGQRQVIFRANLNHVNYRQITAQDGAGNPVSSCSRDVFIIQDDVATLTLNNTGENSNFLPDCGAKIVGNNTVSWQLAFKQYPTIATQYDVTFLVTCNFSHADVLQKSSHVKHPRGNRAPERLQPSHVDVSLSLVDAVDGLKTTEANVGDPVRLVVKYRKGDGSLGVESVAPYSCQAFGVNATDRLALTDARGCPVADAPVYLDPRATVGNGTVTYTSKMFHVFTFPGQRHLFFSCGVHICFSENVSNCSNWCTNGTESRRSTRAQENPDPKTVTTVLAVEGFP